MSRARASLEDGFSLVEVMVAMSVLLIGVLGAVMMIDGANAATSRTKAREGGTALARTVLEVSRGVPYEDLTAARVLTEMQARGGLADGDPVAPGHQVESQGFVYTVAPSVCSMDDPKDAVGEHDLGITFCSNSATSGGTGVDRNPDDYRQVSVGLTWSAAGQPASLTQTGIVTNPVGGLGPSVIDLDSDTPDTENITTDVQAPTYDVQTSTAAASVTWFVNGQAMTPEAIGSGTEWGFTWNLGPHDDPNAQFLDCTYVVQAEALDDKGRAGAPKALTITLNRNAPFAPTGLQGGRNLRAGTDGRHVDLQWQANRECDVKGYRIYRTEEGGVETLIATVVGRHNTKYVDMDAPTAGAKYEIEAVDTHPDGSDRSGLRNADEDDVMVGPHDPIAEAPALVENVSVCLGGTGDDCKDINQEVVASGTVVRWTPSGEGIIFYRVYRGGTTYADRIGILFPVESEFGVPISPLVFIDTTVSGSEPYYVSAVDESFAESEPVQAEDLRP